MWHIRQPEYGESLRFDLQRRRTIPNLYVETKEINIRRTLLIIQVWRERKIRLQMRCAAFLW